MQMKDLIFGAAYYDEYMPCDRLEKDIAMMKKAGINTVRIAESTWSTCEPFEGVFDFSHVIRVLDAMDKAGINVIVGTPTYAVPSWMVRSHPDILATTVSGRELYGKRQNMDITNPAYLFYCERIIRKLMEVSAGHRCVIGFQLDNETKYYGTAGANVQHRFVEYLKKEFQGDIEKMNDAFGLDYWSNRINKWEDFPDVRGTVNGSLASEFEKFQRGLVTEFLGWQARIVREYIRPDQFITHNLDFEWRGYSYGIHPDVNQRDVAGHLTIAGCDIYHPSQDHLTGTEIAFGGDICRSMKKDNYLIIETEAQGFPCWTPYPGQLRLQAYSHLASGANGVMYWHWHSIHNSVETYWKGLLSHDFEENETYREACRIGAEWGEVGPFLINLKKTNACAILVSNESLTALKHFGIQATASANDGIRYNDVFRWIYDTLYRMNVECDIIWPEEKDLEQYRVIFVPALYAASDELLERLRTFAMNGGHLIATFKTGFCDEYVKVHHDVQPHILRDVMGVSYDQFVFPEGVGLISLYEKSKPSGADATAALRAGTGSPVSTSSTDESNDGLQFEEQAEEESRTADEEGSSRGYSVEKPESVEEWMKELEAGYSVITVEKRPERDDHWLDELQADYSRKMNDTESEDENTEAEGGSRTADSEADGADHDDAAVPEDGQEAVTASEADACSGREPDMSARYFMELLRPEGADVLLSYDHKYWGKYAAVTRRKLPGGGSGTYIGTMFCGELLEEVLREILNEAGIEASEAGFPLIIRKGTNDFEQSVLYYLNYSDEVRSVEVRKRGKDAFDGSLLQEGQIIEVGPWDLRIVLS